MSKPKVLPSAELVNLGNIRQYLLDWVTDPLQELQTEPFTLLLCHCCYSVQFIFVGEWGAVLCTKENLAAFLLSTHY